MKKNLLTVSILIANTFCAQIYTPTGNVAGVTTNSATGNIGIGINTPKRKLHIVNGDVYVDGAGVFNFGDDARFIVNKTDLPSMRQTSFSMGQYGIAAAESVGSAELWISGNDGIRMFTRGYAKPRISVLNDGRVGIGSINPDSELTVKGKIHAEEVKVDLNVPADYVFQKYYTGTSSLKPEYTVPTLEEVEKFTRKNNHLPNIPSAKQIQEEGLHLAEVTNLLLQKIEELTLYSIEQNKQLKQQAEEIEMLKKRMKRK